MEKVAIVSGAASGIGRCIVQNLKMNNVKVFCLDIDEVDIDDVIYYQCDVSNEIDVINCVNQITLYTNKIDYLINVAGILCDKDKFLIENLPLKEWNRVFEVNLNSVFLMTKYVIPLLKASNNGVILNFSSDQVVLTKRKSAPYAVTKAAIEMFTKIVALELLDDKIRANTISLSSVDTNFIKKYINNDKRMNEMMLSADQEMAFGIIKPKDVVELVNYLISENNKMTGQTILIDSGVVLDTQSRKRRK